MKMIKYTAVQWIVRELKVWFITQWKGFKLLIIQFDHFSGSLSDPSYNTGVAPAAPTLTAGRAGTTHGWYCSNGICLRDWWKLVSSSSHSMTWRHVVQDVVIYSYGLSKEFGLFLIFGLCNSKRLYKFLATDIIIIQHQKCSLL